MTNWFCNNGDAISTGYWAVATWKPSTSYATGSIVRQQGGLQTFGIAVDFTNSKCWMIDLTNNPTQWLDSGTANPGTNTGGLALSVAGALFPTISLNNGAGAITANFGATAFVGSLPTGFSSVNTANGSAVTWDPAFVNSSLTLSGGNLTATSVGNSGWYGSRATASFSAGKIYWEVTLGWGAVNTSSARLAANNPQYAYGYANTSQTNGQQTGNTANSVGWSGGFIWYNGGSLLAIHNTNPIAVGNERCFINNGSTFTSGTTQPSWNLAQSGTTADGAGTWTECTGQAAYGWNAPWSRFTTLVNSRGLGQGDVAFVGDNSQLAEVATGNVGENTFNGYPTIISVDHTVSSPTGANALPGAAFWCTGSGFTWAYNFHLIGFTINMFGPGGGNATLCTGASVQRYTNCTFNLTGTGGSSTYIQFGPGNTVAQIYWENITINSTGGGIAPLATGGGRFLWRGGSVATVSGQPAFRSGNGAGGDHWIEAVDFSSVGGTAFGAPNIGCPATFFLTRCKSPVAGFMSTVETALGYSETQWYACEVGVDQQSHGRSDGAGVQIDSRVVVRTGGASDGLASYSEQITTAAGALYYSPFRTLPMDIWNSLTGSNRTITFYGIANMAAMPQTTDLWLSIRYLGAATSLLGSEATNKPAPLATGTSYTADTSAWDSAVPARQNSHSYNLGDVLKVASNPGRVFFCTSPGINASSEPAAYASAVDGTSVTTDGSPNFRAGWRFKIALTLSAPPPQLAGLITSQFEMAKTGEVFFIDPLPVLS